MLIPDKIEGDRQTKQNSQESTRLTCRSIRSFVVRNGRVTSAQNEATKRLMPRFGVNYVPAYTDLATQFGRLAPLWVEIGFGNGDALLHMASQHPDVNVLGIEVHAAGIGHALLGIERRQLENVRIIQHDAMEVLEQMILPSSLQRILLFFPDPWHKKRHHKRRIVQSDFVQAAAAALIPGGLLHCATDWPDYADWMLDHIEPDNRFCNVAGHRQVSEKPTWRPTTRFEKRGQRLGHPVSDFVFERTATA
jgi:tRNA (guanine-N7-)-methyltransferase